MGNLQISESAELEEAANGPPAKKRKLSKASDEVEAQVDTKENTNAKKRGKQLNVFESPAVITMESSKAEGHVIAVTGEDKSIRVFEVASNGSLKQVSQRAMPKRPCAVVITDDDSTIISADKFGDVYALPLLPEETSAEAPSAEEDSKTGSQTPEPAAGRFFKPAANEFTIHSVRNRKALENQKRQTNWPKEKTDPTFEHNLLLGHVSMLTDLLLTTRNGRKYIITADRDEHIRISRGMPQTHIIEGFCLGHTEFISRLCIPAGRDDILVSGGGEDELYIWDWLSGKLLSKAALRNHVDSAVRDASPEAGSKKPTVSGIYHAKASVQDSRDLIIVSCEAVPALFVYCLTAQKTLEHHQTVSLPGNALSVAINTVGGASQMLVVSVDCIHKPNFAKERRDQTVPCPSLVALSITDKGLSEVSPLLFAAVKDEGAVSEKELAKLPNLLYNIENFRKREGAPEEE
ncbi:hypothetical protein BP5796_05988 [Coleophoma crateriformis]|uniref:Uncharacterized protein n=1 Tax=Coleophoma crateriformis TaxID=565419 RepID=A0A3D8RVY2_9HELO|nr:hypothetical protein BP5796_05988 [Coleophoma crateriformis]